MKRPLHREDKSDLRVVQLHLDRGSRDVANLQGLRLDASKQVEYASVLEPHLVVQESSELLGQQTYGGLRALTGVDPVEVDARQPLVVFGDGLYLLQAAKQFCQLGAPIR